MNKRTDSKENEMKTSKQRQDEMYARLIAREAKIQINHERYLAIMAAADDRHCRVCGSAGHTFCNR